MPKSLGLTHSVRGRFHPPGGLPGRPADGPGGACLSNAGQGGQGRAGEPLQGRACVPVFKAGAQAWTGLPAGQGRVGMGIILTLGGCVAAQGPEGNAGQLVPARGKRWPAGASLRETVASWWSPGPAVVSAAG